MTEPSNEIPPKLYGDGVHDDTDAVQWYLDRDLPLPDPPGGIGYSVNASALRLPARAAGYRVIPG